MASSRWSRSTHSFARFASKASPILRAKPTGKAQGTAVLKGRFSMSIRAGRRYLPPPARTRAPRRRHRPLPRARPSGPSTPGQHRTPADVSAPRRAAATAAPAVWIEYRPPGQLVAEHQDRTLREEEPVGHAFVQLIAPMSAAPRAMAGSTLAPIDRGHFDGLAGGRAEPSHPGQHCVSHADRHPCEPWRRISVTKKAFPLVSACSLTGSRSVPIAQLGHRRRRKGRDRQAAHDRDRRQVAQQHGDGFGAVDIVAVADDQQERRSSRSAATGTAADQESPRRPSGRPR